MGVVKSRLAATGNPRNEEKMTSQREQSATIIIIEVLDTFCFTHLGYL